MSFQLGYGLWFMCRSSSHLVRAIILHMIIIILFCLLIIAISQGVLARWSHLIWMYKDHSTWAVVSLRRQGLHYPNEKQAGEEVVSGWLVFTTSLLFKLLKDKEDKEGLWDDEMRLFFVLSRKKSRHLFPHAATALCSVSLVFFKWRVKSTLEWSCNYWFQPSRQNNFTV